MKAFTIVKVYYQERHMQTSFKEFASSNLHATVNLKQSFIRLNLDDTVVDWKFITIRDMSDAHKLAGIAIDCIDWMDTPCNQEVYGYLRARVGRPLPKKKGED